MEVLLNADFLPAKVPGNESLLIGLIDLVNLDGGLFGYDDEECRRVAREAVARGVRIGALVGCASGAEMRASDLTRLLSEKVGRSRKLLEEAGGSVQHVKLHGAPADLCQERTDLAEACVDWMEAELEGIPLIVGAGGLLHAVAEARGVPLLREICAGRGYADEARFIPHAEAGALIEDPDEAAQRISAWRATGFLSVGGGKQWLVEAETVCVPADSPRSVEIARAVRGALALQ